MIELTLVSRRDCHLCDEMLAALHPVLAGRSVTIGHRNVDGDPELTRRFGMHVPVLLADGAVLCAHRLDAARVVAALAGEPWEPLELR